jgi:hypothetical protein
MRTRIFKREIVVAGILFGLFVWVVLLPEGFVTDAVGCGAPCDSCPPCFSGCHCETWAGCPACDDCHYCLYPLCSCYTYCGTSPCCHGHCCSSGATCCSDGRCCSRGGACCGAGCCDPGAHCCSSNGHCCLDGKNCCGNSGCCDPDKTCCGDGHCCDPTQCQTCVDGTCQFCGGDEVNKFCCYGNCCDKRKCEYCDPETQSCKPRCKPEKCEECDANSWSCKSRCKSDECCIDGACVESGLCWILPRCNSSTYSCGDFDESVCNSMTEQVNYDGHVHYRCSSDACCYPSSESFCASVYSCYYDSFDKQCEQSVHIDTISGSNYCSDRTGGHGH